MKRLRDTQWEIRQQKLHRITQRYQKELLPSLRHRWETQFTPWVKKQYKLLSQLLKFLIRKLAEGISLFEEWIAEQIAIQQALNFRIKVGTLVAPTEENEDISDERLCQFSVRELKNSGRFALRLQRANDPLTLHLRGRLSPETQTMIDAYSGAGQPSEALKIGLVEDLNRVLKEGNLFRAQQYGRLVVSKRIKEQVEYYPDTVSRAKLNRLLLEEAFPHELVTMRSRNVSPMRHGEIVEVTADQLRHHLYVLGASGSGKSKLLEHIICQHINCNQGIVVVDPHGDLCRDVCRYLLHQTRRGAHFDPDRLILVEPHRTDFIAGFNPLNISQGSLPAHVSEILAICRRLWSASWGLRMGDLFRHCLLALALTGHTLVEVPAFLTDPAFRRRVLEDVQDETVKDYFLTRYDSLTDAARTTHAEPILNKLDELFSDPRIRALLGQREDSLDIRKVMDRGNCVLLVSLDKGQLRSSSGLIGSFLTAQIFAACTSRSDVPLKQRVPTTLVVDEFQNFRGDSFELMLTEARKFALRLVLAHQHLSQLDPPLQDAVLGGAGTHALFAVSPRDVRAVSQELSGAEGKVPNLVHLPPRHCLLHRRGQPLCHIETIPLKEPDISESELEVFMKELRKRHGKPLTEVEEEINARRRALRTPTPDPPKAGRKDGEAKGGPLHDDLCRPAGGETESGPITEGDDD